jgi:DNA replication protein DnaC
MDDFGTQNATAWAQEKLFQILNQRYAERLPTVITSNYGLQDFEGRIRSRLMDPDVVTRVTLIAPDYRDPTDDHGHPELSYLNLHHKLRFENFDQRMGEGLKKEERDTLKNGLHLAQQFAQNPRGWLYFTGPNGSGKTHLAAAIGNYRSELGFPPLMVGVPDLLDHLRAAFAPGSAINLDRRFDEIRQAPLLILDDLGTESATPWAREKLYQLFNYRYITELPTVITSDKLPDELESRLESRLIDERLCKIVVLGVPAYKGGKNVRR